VEPAARVIRLTIVGNDFRLLYLRDEYVARTASESRVELCVASYLFVETRSSLLRTCSRLCLTLGCVNSGILKNQHPQSYLLCFRFLTSSTFCRWKKRVTWCCSATPCWRIRLAACREGRTSRLAANRSPLTMTKNHQNATRSTSLHRNTIAKGIMWHCFSSLAAFSLAYLWIDLVCRIQFILWASWYVAHAF